MHLLPLSLLIANVVLGGIDRDEELPISVRLAMCPAERDRDPLGCRASGLTPELPVHVVMFSSLLVPQLLRLQALVPGVQRTSTASPLLFPRFPSEVSASPSLGVSKKVWILLVPPTALSSRRIFSRLFAAPNTYGRGRLSDGHIAMKLNKNKNKKFIVDPNTN